MIWGADTVQSKPAPIALIDPFNVINVGFATTGKFPLPFLWCDPFGLIIRRGKAYCSICGAMMDQTSMGGHWQTGDAYWELTCRLCGFVEEIYG